MTGARRSGRAARFDLGVLEGICLASIQAMSLSQYTQARLVVQRPDTSAYDAIRAMEDNHVGAILVHNGQELIGVVTDRDLALQVLADELDPRETQLREIMSSPVAALPVTASESEAAAAMRNRHVRRIPIVDGYQLVGLVTLDDLILAQSVDAALLAEVVRAQLADPSRLKSAGEAHPTRPESDVATRRERAERRHAGRATLSYGDLIARTLTATALETRERAEAALEEVLSGIVRRVNKDEARQLLAQVPSVLRERLTGVARGPDRAVTRETIEQALTRRLGTAPAHASVLVVQVCDALGATISAGEIDNVRNQLPADMRGMLATIRND